MVVINPNFKLRFSNHLSTLLTYWFWVTLGVTMFQGKACHQLPDMYGKQA